MMSRLSAAKNLLLGFVAVVALVMATQPFGRMSSSTELVVACVVLAVSAVLGFIILRDNPRDEREALLIINSERVGFVTGIMVASIGALWGAYNGAHNTMVEVILACMVLAKLLANLYYSNVK